MAKSNARIASEIWSSNKHYSRIELTREKLDASKIPSQINSRVSQNKRTISALKHPISVININTTRAIEELGHLYADAVVHCDKSPQGNFVWTLTVTDDLTLRTNSRAIWNKGQKATCKAFLYPLREMPFMVRSVDADTGQSLSIAIQRKGLKKNIKGAG